MSPREHYSRISNTVQNTFNKQNPTETEYFLNYCSFMAKIDAPFINTTITPGEYVVGYIVEAYDETMTKLYYSVGPNINQKFIDAFNLTYQIFEILNKMYQLKKIGIIISHRDTTTNNIMYTKDLREKNRFKIRLIDFGFLCERIICKNGDTISLGYHTSNVKKDLYKCNNSSIDLVSFIVFCIRYTPQLFNVIKRITGIDAITRLENIITSKSIKDTILSKKTEKCKRRNRSGYGPWQYSSSTRLSSMIRHCRINYMMFTEVFNIMDEKKTQIAIKI